MRPDAKQKRSNLHIHLGQLAEFVKNQNYLVEIFVLLWWPLCVLLVLVRLHFRLADYLLARANHPINFHCVYPVYLACPGLELDRY